MFTTALQSITRKESSNSRTSSTSQQSITTASRAERNRIAQRNFQQRQRDTVQYLEAHVLELQRIKAARGGFVETQPPSLPRRCPLPTFAKTHRNLKHMDANADLSHLPANERRTILNRLAQRASRQRRIARITKLTAQVNQLQNELGPIMTPSDAVALAVGPMLRLPLGQPPVLSLGSKICLPALVGQWQEQSGTQLPSLRSLGLLDLSEGGTIQAAPSFSLSFSSRHV